MRPQKGLAYRRLPVENKFSNTFQINTLPVIAYWQLAAMALPASRHYSRDLRKL